MKRGITKTAPRITDRSAEFYRRTFGSINAGMEYVGDSFPYLYRATISALKGRFDMPEIRAIMNGGPIAPPNAHIAGKQLLLALPDRMAEDNLARKWGINGTALYAKISSLTIFEAACLEIWIEGFWSQGPEGDIETYVNELV